MRLTCWSSKGNQGSWHEHFSWIITTATVYSSFNEVLLYQINTLQAFKYSAMPGQIDEENDMPRPYPNHKKPPRSNPNPPSKSKPPPYGPPPPYEKGEASEKGQEKMGSGS
jgi:hypothetical protein